MATTPRTLIARLLASKGLCVQCMVRFAPDLIPWELIIDDAAALEWLGLEPSESSKAVDGVCPGCFGILENVPGTLDTVFKEIADSGYELNGCNLVVSTPPALLVRDEAIQWFIEKTLPSVGRRSRQLVEVKDSVRWGAGKYAADKPWKFENRNSLKVHLTFSHSESDNEVVSAIENSTVGEPRKKRRRKNDNLSMKHAGSTVSRTEVNKYLKKLLSDSSIEDIDGFAQVNTRCSFSTLIRRDPIFLRGRYLKLLRGLSQTPWLIGGQRKGDFETSLAELVYDDCKTLFQAPAAEFHSAGREDIDVRMLGNGRPFVVQLNDARLESGVSAGQIKALEDKINLSGDVIVKGLRQCSRDAIAALEEGALSKRKQYTCLVYTSTPCSRQVLKEKLDSLSNVTLQQKTPIRVLHRRSQLVREKQIHSLETVWINDHYFELILTTSAGTYVKEFVHGDFGRTQPNVGGILGGAADILQLDVTGHFSGSGDDVKTLAVGGPSG